MILLTSVIISLPLAYMRARFGRRPLSPPKVRWMGIVFIAFLPQWLAFYQPMTRTRIPNAWVPPILVSSQSLLLLFAWRNRRQPGFWAMGLGLALNWLVIMLNGGWMPISPMTLQRMDSTIAPEMWQIGTRLGWSKDKILLPTTTRLWWLSDCWILPAWLQYHVAFSIGDIFIALGAFLLMWSLGNPPKQKDNDTSPAYN